MAVSGGGEGLARSIYVALDLQDRMTNTLSLANTKIEGFKSALQAAGVPIDRMQSGFETATVKASSYADTIRSRINEANTYVQDHAEQLAFLGAELTLVGAKGTAYFKEGLSEASTYQVTYATLYKSMGDDTESFMVKMRAASGELLTDGEIIRETNFAKGMGVDLKNLPILMEAARAASRKMGGDVGTYYEAIVMGAATEQERALKRVGLEVDAAEAWEKYGKAIYQTGKYTETEAKSLGFQQALLAAAKKSIEETDWSTASYNGTLRQTTTSLTEVQEALAGGLIPILMPFLTIVRDVALEFKRLPAWLTGAIGVILAFATVITLASGALLVQTGVMKMVSAAAGQQVGIVSLLTGAYGRFAMVALSTVAPQTAAAIANGTLTVSLSGMIPILGAILVETAPLILAILAIAGAVLLIQDLMAKGWEDSWLKKFVDFSMKWLPLICPPIYAVIKAVEYLKPVFQSLYDFLKPIIDAITGFVQNSVIQSLILAGQFLMDPVNTTISAGKSAATQIGQAQRATATARANSPGQVFRGGTTTSNNVTVQLSIPNMTAKGMDEKEIRGMFSDVTRDISNSVEGSINRKLTRDLSAMGA